MLECMQQTKTLDTKGLILRSILAEISALFISLDQDFDSRRAQGIHTIDQVIQETRKLTDHIALEHVKEDLEVLDALDACFREK